MIVRAETLISMDEFKDMDKGYLSMKLNAIESLIRSYTNNHFQSRGMRISAPSVGGSLLGHSPYFIVGDTVQISKSINEGLYVIKEISGSRLAVDYNLFDFPSNIVTKVIYPADIQKGVIDLLLWEKDNREKVGIKSETVSRHTVTYFDQDSANQVMGYPVSLLGFLHPYKKARF